MLHNFNLGVKNTLEIDKNQRHDKAVNHFQELYLLATAVIAFKHKYLSQFGRSCDY